MSDRENFFGVIRNFQSAMLVSRRTGGSLHVRPMAVAEIKEDGDTIFATNIASPKIAEIANDPNVLLTFQDGSKFASLIGRARFLRDQAEIDRLWSETWRVWFPKGNDDPALCLLTIDAQAGWYWDNAGLKGLKYVLESIKGCRNRNNSSRGRQTAR